MATGNCNPAGLSDLARGLQFIASGEMEDLMSMEKGLTSWVLRAGHVGLAYRWNMGFREAIHTFCIKRGQTIVVACGPVILEWN